MIINSKSIKQIKLFTILLFSIILIACNNKANNTDEKELVILDTDMVAGLDDGIAMMMLAQADHIDLLGVTIMAGNTHVNEGVAYSIRQLEIIDRTDVPVMIGATKPLRDNRFDLMIQEIDTLSDVWLGSGGYPSPESWEKFYISKYNEEPIIQPSEINAVDFIIEQVKRHPDRITIAAIGPCTNLALAIQKAPEIVPLIKRVVYMSGAFFCDGNSTKASEFNSWFDPDAADIAMKSAFNEQLFFGLDVCNTVELTKERFDKLQSLMTSTNLKEVMDDSYAAYVFSENPTVQWWICARSEERLGGLGCRLECMYRWWSEHVNH